MNGQAIDLDPPWFLSRARLRRDAPVAALAPLLLPDEDGPRVAAGHRLVWSLFAGDADASRDFLYREEGLARAGRFTILSRRPPVDTIGLFELDTKNFAPVLKAGDRLGFALRVNPVVQRKTPGKPRSRRSDVVMDRLKPIPKGERAPVRDAMAREATLAWLERQGERSGFALSPGENGFRVDGYDQVKLPRRGKEPVEFSRLDIEGVLSVVDPTAFMTALTTGFGKAKAFGCGLMLIRRA